MNNPRIKLLADQATEWTLNSGEPIPDPDVWQQKFAQLVILASAAQLSLEQQQQLLNYWGIEP